jgi:hypothetical protein
MKKHEQFVNLFDIGHVLDRLFVFPSGSNTTSRQGLGEGEVPANAPDAASGPEASGSPCVRAQTDVERRRRVIEAIEIHLLRGS